MDTFPYDSWEEALAAAQEGGEAFFTFGSDGAGVVILTILGVIAMIGSVVLWVATEKYNLDEHVKRIRDEGMIG